MRILLFISIIMSLSYDIVFANTSYYSNDGITSSQYETINNNYYDDKSYCSPQNGFLSRLKRAFIGEPTGYTPQIEPSAYLNHYGPSYNQGFYTPNVWNDHNIYNPIYSGTRAGINILN